MHGPRSSFEQKENEADVTLTEDRRPIRGPRSSARDAAVALPENQEAGDARACAPRTYRKDPKYTQTRSEKG